MCALPHSCFITLALRSVIVKPLELSFCLGWRWLLGPLCFHVNFPICLFLWWIRFLMAITSHFFIVLIRHHGQGHVRRKSLLRAYSFKGWVYVHALSGRLTAGRQAWCWSSSWKLTSRSSNTRQKDPAENGIPTPSKATLPNTSQTILPTGDQSFKHLGSYRCYSHLNHHILVNDHFNSINSASPWAWEAFTLLVHPQFLSSSFSKFYPTCLLFPWISLFLGLQQNKTKTKQQ